MWKIINKVIVFSQGKDQEENLPNIVKILLNFSFIKQRQNKIIDFNGNINMSRDILHFLCSCFLRGWQILPLWIRVDLGVMAMKEYSTFLASLELDPY